MSIVVDTVDREDRVFLDGRVSFGGNGRGDRVLQLDIVLCRFAICGFVSMEEGGHDRRLQLKQSGQGALLGVDSLFVRCFHKVSGGCM